MDDGWSVIVSVPSPQYLVLFINTYYLGQPIIELDYPIYIADLFNFVHLGSLASRDGHLGCGLRRTPFPSLNGKFNGYTRPEEQTKHASNT